MSTDPVREFFNDGGYTFHGGAIQALPAVTGDQLTTLDQVNALIAAIPPPAASMKVYRYDDPAGNPYTTPSIPAGSLVYISGSASGGSGESTSNGNGGGSAAACRRHLYIPETTATWTVTVSTGAAGVTGGDGNTGGNGTLILDNGDDLILGGGEGGNITNAGDGGLPSGAYLPVYDKPAATGGTTSANGVDAYEYGQGIWSGAGGCAGATPSYYTGAADAWPAFRGQSISGSGPGAPSIWGGDDYYASGVSYDWQPLHWGAGSAGSDNAATASGTTRDGFWLLEVHEPSN